MTAEKRKKVQRKIKIGTVISDKMKKTVVVEVKRMVKHPLYQKYIRHRSKFYAEDSNNQCKEGDKVRIIETRPLSKLKRWKVVEVIEKAE